MRHTISRQDAGDKLPTTPPPTPTPPPPPIAVDTPQVHTTSYLHDCSILPLPPPLLHKLFYQVEMLWQFHADNISTFYHLIFENFSCTYMHVRGVKKNNGVFIIPLFLLKNFRYSIIPAQKVSLFHYFCSKISLFHSSSQKSIHYSIIPRTKFPLFLFHYSSSAPKCMW